jgi:hypothetical protein
LLASDKQGSLEASAALATLSPDFHDGSLSILAVHNELCTRFNKAFGDVFENKKRKQARLYKLP